MGKFGNIRPIIRRFSWGRRDGGGATRRGPVGCGHKSSPVKATSHTGPRNDCKRHGSETALIEHRHRNIDDNRNWVIKSANRKKHRSMTTSTPRIVQHGHGRDVIRSPSRGFAKLANGPHDAFCTYEFSSGDVYSTRTCLVDFNWIEIILYSALPQRVYKVFFSMDRFQVDCRDSMF